MSTILEGDTGLSEQEYEALFSPPLPPRPYPGLRAFEKGEWPIFFGRERMTDDVVAHLVHQHLLVLHGDSGCGKSSLLRAGVLPRLEQTNARGGARWRTCTVTPGEAPLNRLAIGLAGLVGGADAPKCLYDVRRRLDLGLAAPAALAAVLCPRDGAHVCILIDQFEELFAHASREGAKEAQCVIDLLVGLHEKPPRGLYAAITMRSEFLGACARYTGFAEVVNTTQYLLPRMGHDDVVRAICEPAAMYEGSVSRSVAEWMIADAGNSQDQLPLLQHALMLLHRASGGAPGWTIGEEARAKSLSQRLSEHADEVKAQVEAALGPGCERLVEDIMRALTQINADGHAIRRPCTVRELAQVTGAGEEAVRVAVDHLRADGASFLLPGPQAPLRADTRVDISHEALIRCWQPLANSWLEAELRNGLVWRSLRVQAESFERDANNTLSPATYLERTEWLKRRNGEWARRYGGGWERVQALLGASRKARRRHLLTLALPGFLVLIAIGGILNHQRNALIVEEERRAAAAQANMQATESLRTILVGPTQTAPALVEAKLQDALNALNEQLRALDEQEAALQTDRGLVDLPPRVYFHVQRSEDRASAAALERELEKRSIGSSAIVVPGIEVRAEAHYRNTLRCFKVAECDEARQIVQILNGELLAKPNVTLEDMSARYQNSTGIRPRHYELWIGEPLLLRQQ